MREACGLYSKKWLRLAKNFEADEFRGNMLHEYYSQTLDKILLERRKKKYFLGQSESYDIISSEISNEYSKRYVESNSTHNL